MPFFALLQLILFVFRVLLHIYNRFLAALHLLLKYQTPISRLFFPKMLFVLVYSVKHFKTFCVFASLHLIFYKANYLFHKICFLICRNALWQIPYPAPVPWCPYILRFRPGLPYRLPAWFCRPCPSIPVPCPESPPETRR